jgi:hypothetical protein
MGAGTDGDWEQALDAIEDRLERTETQLARPGPSEIRPDVERWSPPELDTPLPAHLADRVRSLLARTQEVSDRVRTAAERVRRERAAADRISRATARPRAAVYVDRSA